MSVKSAVFKMSNQDYLKCPKPDMPEYAFIGRSNVGKSSLINMLTNKKGLAKTSSKPGKTQLINHFLIDENWYLVDLPGYGWAQVSKEKKKSWGPMIEKYLINRKNLLNVFILVDSRHEPQKIDVEFINWMGQSGIPFSIILTKADKLSKNQAMSNMARIKKELLNYWEELPPFFLTSAEKKQGKEELLNFIDQINSEHQNTFTFAKNI